jgi:hypothetical protein
MRPVLRVIGVVGALLGWSFLVGRCAGMCSRGCDEECRVYAPLRRHGRGDSSLLRLSDEMAGANGRCRIAQRARNSLRAKHFSSQPDMTHELRRRPNLLEGVHRSAFGVPRPHRGATQAQAGGSIVRPQEGAPRHGPRAAPDWGDGQGSSTAPSAPPVPRIGFTRGDRRQGQLGRGL